MQNEEEPIEVKHKKFSNGDVYLGGWRAGLVSSTQQQLPRRRRRASTAGAPPPRAGGCWR
jgi:hypothetical protein